MLQIADIDKLLLFDFVGLVYNIIIFIFYLDFEWRNIVIVSFYSLCFVAFPIGSWELFLLVFR